MIPVATALTGVGGFFFATVGAPGDELGFCAGWALTESGDFVAADEDVVARGNPDGSFRDGGQF